MAKKKFDFEKFRMPKKENLNTVKFGLAGGIVIAVCIFITTLTAVIFPGYALSFIILFTGIYGFLGYNMTLLGAILGAIYGFVDGFILTWLFAWIYNKLI